METGSSQSNISGITRHFTDSTNPKKMLMIVVISSVVLGAITGYVLSSKGSSSSSGVLTAVTAPKTAEQDNRTFRDFAEGTIKAKPQSKNGADYAEGTHYLHREGAVPVALTSSVVDLSQYEGKKVKVYGETQKALKEGWLMDVGKVEEVQ